MSLMNGSHKKLSLSRLAHTARPGAVFLYVLFSVTLFMLVFSSLIFFLNRNLDFVAKAFVRNRLAYDSLSTAEKVLGVFQANPGSTLLLNQATGKRDVEVKAYVNSLEGYVYAGKSDFIRLRGTDYMADQTVPSSVTFQNSSVSTADLIVVIRIIDPVSSNLLSTKTLKLAPNSAPVAYSFLDGSNQILLSKNAEIILASATAGDVVYTLTADQPAAPAKPATILQKDLGVSVTAYENLKSLNVGENFSQDRAIPLELSSYNLLYKTDFETGNFNFNGIFSSSPSQPGLSTAFIDTFDIAPSGADWSNLTAANHNATSGSLTLPAGQEIILNSNLNGDFDLRVVLKTPGTVSGARETGIFVKQGTEYYQAGVREINKFTASGSTCVAASPATDLGYVMYRRSAPPAAFNYGDGSSVCSGATFPLFKEYDPDTSFMLRLVRQGGNLDAYYCNEKESCDVAGSNWPLVNESPLTGVSGPVQVGLYTQNMETTVEYVRASNTNITGTNFATYTKNIDFGRTVTIKKVEVNGYLPNMDDLEIRLNDVIQDNSRIFVPKDSSGQNVSTAKLEIGLQTPAIGGGDLSEIPFIRGVRMFYELE